MIPSHLPKPQPKITLKFLAEHLGLSRTTVSIVLNHAPQSSTISASTRKRILDAAAQFDYKPSFLGRSLNAGRSFLIGVISPDLAEGYTAGLLGGIEQFLMNSEYQFFTASHYWSPVRAQQTTQLFIDRGVEGILMVNTPYSSRLSLPTVHIGRTHDEPCGTSLIVHNHMGVLLGMRHLVELGHRKLAFIRGHQGSVDSEDRWNAVLAAAQELSVPIDPHLVVQLERLDLMSLSAIEEGARCADQLIPHRGQFTALMAFNDMSAIGAINRFRSAGWSIPQDLSVLGFDDVVEARIAFPALSTIQQPLHSIGEAAARELIECIANGTPRRTLTFFPTLVVRDSTAPCCPTPRLQPLRNLASPVQ